MTDINQNFSLMVGDTTTVFFDIGPDDEESMNLEFVDELTWKAYRQVMGVPDTTQPLIEKGIGSGVEIEDPLLMQFTVSLAGSDTEGLAGNYFHETRIIANHGEKTTVATGLMTVIDPALAPNVVAFKQMFPDFADADDTEIQIALDAAGRFVDDAWGLMQVPATMYLAAHFLSMATSTSDTSGQIITSESIGRISVGYASSAASGGGADTLGSTSYGIVFGNMLTAQGYGIAVV